MSISGCRVMATFPPQGRNGINVLRCKTCCAIYNNVVKVYPSAKCDTTGYPKIQRHAPPNVDFRKLRIAEVSAIGEREITFRACDNGHDSSGAVATGSVAHATSGGALPHRLLPTVANSARLEAIPQA